MSVSLTKFIDFVNSTGLKKRQIVTDTISDDKYEPYKDFYKNFREAIVALHKEGASADTLNGRIRWSNNTKIKHFQSLVQGYQKWACNKKLSYIPVDSCQIDLGGIQLTINPELALKIGRQPTIIKLYLKEKPLLKGAADMITTLLATSYRMHENTYSNYNFTVLDVRQAKLFRLTANTRVDALLSTLTIEAETWFKYTQISGTL